MWSFAENELLWNTLSISARFVRSISDRRQEWRNSSYPFFPDRLKRTQTVYLVAYSGLSVNDAKGVVIHAQQ